MQLHYKRPRAPVLTLCHIGDSLHTTKRLLTVGEIYADPFRAIVVGLIGIFEKMQWRGFPEGAIH